MQVRLAALLFVAACGDDLVDPFAGLVPVSGLTPFALGCNGAAQTGLVFRSAEVEPWLAIDPRDPAHLVATWQQDRWSSGGANGNLTAASNDGGATWTIGQPAFGHCAGGDYERTSDPWVAIAADGVFASGIAFDNSGPRSGVVASRSSDGIAWDPPAVLIADDDPDIFDDKDSLAADALHVYAVWDRLTGVSKPTMPVGTGPTYLARFTAGAWEPARPIYDPGIDAQTLGNVMVALPDGTLVDIADRLTSVSAAEPVRTAVAIRSTDHGDTWSQPVEIAPLDGAGVTATDGVAIRTGADLPQVASDPHTGAIYVAWEISAGDHDGIAISRSSDGGQTWSAPVRVDAGGVGAFDAMVAVSGTGAVGVLYYDLRGSDAQTARATAWLATSLDGGATWIEKQLAVFGLAPANIGGQYFLGDYEGLAAADHFVPLFAAGVESDDPTELFVRP